MIVVDAFAYIVENWPMFWTALRTHLEMCAISLAIGILVAVPVGILVARSPRLSFAAINTAGAIRTIPSLAILAITLPYLGIGLLPSIVALIVLAIPPILLNTCVGIREIDPDAIDAATGMGMTRRQQILQIELPMALPSIVAGIKTATIQVIGGATLASFIGGGGLGDFITAGIALSDMTRLLVGAIPIAILAILSEILFSMIVRALSGNRTPESET